MAEQMVRGSGRGYAWWEWHFGNADSRSRYRVALLLIRVMAGAIFTAHGAQKAFGWFGGKGFDSALGAARNTGFPAPQVFAYLLVAAELVGGICLVIGFMPRVWALMQAFVMVMAIFKAHIPRGDGFLQLHTQEMLLVATLAIVIAGGGALALSPRRRRRTQTPG